MTTAVKTRATLTERSAPVQAGTVDKVARIIRRVAVLGLESVNGGRLSDGRTYKRRRYTEGAARGALGLYAGARVYADHQTEAEARARLGARSVKDLAGVLRDPVFEGGKVFADWHVPAGPLGDHLLSLAETCPECLGLSHDALGEGEINGDELVIDQLTEVYSVDAVDVPATNANLFEGRARGQPTHPHKDDDMTQEAIKEAVRAAVAEVETKLQTKLDEAKATSDKAVKAAEAKAAAAEAKLAEREAADVATKLAETTKALVAEELAAKRLAERLVGAVVKRLPEGKEPTRDEVRAAIDAEVAYLAEATGRDKTATPADLGIVRLDEGDKNKASPVDDARLAEGAFDSLTGGEPAAKGADKGDKDD